LVGDLVDFLPDIVIKTVAVSDLGEVTLRAVRIRGSKRRRPAHAAVVRDWLLLAEPHRLGGFGSVP
jgi:hypothetical protein